MLELICRHPWPLAHTRATNLGLSAARPPTLRVCARPVRATCRPRAQEVSRDGQLSAPRGLRIRAYGSPLARSASGRVLSPRYAAIWPTASLSGGARPSCVTPGQRRTPYAWSSGLLRYRACPRACGLASSAGGKDSPQPSPSRRPPPPATQPHPESAHQEPLQRREDTTCSPTSPVPPADAKRAPDGPTCGRLPAETATHLKRPPCERDRLRQRALKPSHA